MSCFAWYDVGMHALSFKLIDFEYARRWGMRWVMVDPDPIPIMNDDEFMFCLIAYLHAFDFAYGIID